MTERWRGESGSDVGGGSFHVLFHDTVLFVSTGKARRAPAAQATRLDRHRAEMRKRGFKLVQLWVPDPSAPGFRDAVRRTKKFLETHGDPEWDAYAQELLDAAPGWEDA